MTRVLRRQIRSQPVIGIYRLFFSLYVARTVITPGAWLVCGDAYDLPFREGTFAGVYCSDAFSYFHRP